MSTTAAHQRQASSKAYAPSFRLALMTASTSRRPTTFSVRLNGNRRG